MLDRTHDRSDDGAWLGDAVLALVYIVLVMGLFALWIAFARAGAWQFGGCSLLLAAACATGFHRHYSAMVKR